MEREPKLTIPEIITLHERFFHFVKGRRNKTAVYQAEDKTCFLRVGPSLEIEQEVRFHKQLLAQGYPVPELLEQGVRDTGERYFLESSAGEECFGLILARESQEKGTIEEQTFSQFTEIIQKYLNAQSNGVVEASNWESIFYGAHLDFLLEEIPNDKALIMKVWEKVKTDLKGVPFVLCHGDFNAYNIFPAGVIDFETPFNGPLGYDLVSALAHISWFPRSGDTEIQGKYFFSPDQIQRLLELAPDTQKDFDALFILRSIWAVVRLDRFPKLQAWRYRLFREVLDQYLNGESVYDWWRVMPQE